VTGALERALLGLSNGFSLVATGDGSAFLLRDARARLTSMARILVAGLLGGLAWTGPATGQTASSAPQLAVTEATLDNGLRVLVQDDPRNPIVAVQVFYRVGSRNERPGATGLAHFLEHMMFKGTPTYGRGQIARLIEENGGRDNAYTTKDVTSYYTNIAADKLDLVLRIEADRMRHLLLDAAEIDSERKVVTEERRMRSEDDPDGLVYEAMSSLAFKAHPYRWPIIGWMSDIARINRAELRAVTAADLQRVARTYFPLDRKNVSILLPAASATPASK